MPSDAATPSPTPAAKATVVALRDGGSEQDAGGPTADGGASGGNGDDTGDAAGCACDAAKERVRHFGHSSWWLRWVFDGDGDNTPSQGGLRDTGLVFQSTKRRKAPSNDGAFLI